VSRLVTACRYSKWEDANGVSETTQKDRPRTKPRFVALQAAQTAAIEPEKQAEAYCAIRFNGKAGLHIENAETLSQLRPRVKELWG